VLRGNAISHQRDDIEPLRSSTGYDSLSAEEKILATERGKVLVQAYRALCGEAHNEHSMRDVNRDCLLLFMRGAGSWLAKGLVRGDDPRKEQIAAEIAYLLRLGLSPHKPRAHGWARPPWSIRADDDQLYPRRRQLGLQMNAGADKCALIDQRKV
jgi:hypothetical protein